MVKVGFIGLGTMGGPFATNIIKAGFDVTVNDMHRQVAEPQLSAGAKWANTPRELAAVSDVVLTSLPGPPEVEAVALDETDGLIAGMSAGSVLFDLSTNSPTMILKSTALWRKRGCIVLMRPSAVGRRERFPVS